MSLWCKLIKDMSNTGSFLRSGRTWLVLLAVLSVATHTRAWGYKGDRVLLADVPTLTMYKGKMTTSRRSPPVQQIMCVGGDACGQYEPEVINCSNLGPNDRGNIQWQCKAQMEDHFRLGRTTVSCEGYKNRDDKYVLAGSCGVEYTLHLTEKGRAARQYKPDPHLRHQYDARAEKQRRQKSGEGSSSWLWLIGGIAVMIWYYSKKSSSSSSDRANGNGRRPSATAPPPPPPYTTMPPSPKPETAAPRTSESMPGFWSGAATAGLAGFAAGRATAPSSSSSTTYARPQYPSVAVDEEDDYNETTGRPSSSTRYSSGSASAGATTSGTRFHTSTGYGGTQNRSSSRSSSSSSSNNSSSGGFGGTSNR